MNKTPAVIIFIVIAGVMWGVYDTAYATNSTGLDNIRTSVIAAGSIPDTYLIKPSGTYWDARNMTAVYERLEAWTLAKDESIPSERFQSEVNRALFNTAILLEGRIDIHHVTALAIAMERALGTYDVNTVGYLKKYHDYIIDTFDIPNTASSINATLHQKLGDMAPLTDEIVSITHRAASIAGVPNKLLESDIEYWVDIELATYCRLNGWSGGASCSYTQSIPNAIVDGQDAASAGSSYSATWYWRALSCLSSYRGYDYGAVCSDTVSVNAGITRATETVTGSGIYSRLDVNNAPSNTKGTLSISIHKGERDSFSNSSTGTKFRISNYWYAWSNLNDHPCYKAWKYDTSNIPGCVAATTWTFSGTVNVKFPSTTTTTVTPNKAPTANAGKDQTVQIGDKVTLYGSGSDSDGHIRSYSWAQTFGITVTLSNSNVARPTFTAEDAGTLVFKLTVKDNKDSTNSDTVTIKINGPPKADAGGDLVVLPGQQVTLDGSNSSDPDGDDLTYLWTNTRSWVGIKLASSEAAHHKISAAELNDRNTAIPNFAAPTLQIPGDPINLQPGHIVLEFELKVSDGSRTSLDYVNVTVNTTPELEVKRPKTILSYVLETLAPIPHQTARVFGLFEVDPEEIDEPIWQYSGIIAGDARYTLTGTDRDNDNIAITVSDPPMLPNVLVDCDTLPGNGEIRTYNDSEIIVSGKAYIESSICLIPLKEGKGAFGLTITDEFKTSHTNGAEYNIKNPFQLAIKLVSDGESITPVHSYVSILISEENFKTNEKAIMKCKSRLAGVSDKDCDAIRIIQPSPSEALVHNSDVQHLQQPIDNTEWSVITNITQTTVSAHPDVIVIVNTTSIGDRVQFNLRVSGDSTDPTNRTTTIQDHDVDEGSTYSYIVSAKLSNSSVSYIPLGTISIPDETAPSITLLGTVNMSIPFNTSYVESGYHATDNVDGDITSRVTVTATVNTTKAGTYRIYYDVADMAGNPAARQNRTVTILPNDPPLANAGADQTIQIGRMVTLDASASKDPDGGALSYAWRQTSGTAVILSNGTAPYATFAAPGIVGTLAFEVAVSDGFDTDTDAVTITIVDGAPTARAGNDQTVYRLQTVTLDGSASHDPDNDAISYIWNQTSGTEVTLSDDTISNPTFTAPGTIDMVVFDLTVSDGEFSDTDAVAINVVNRPPMPNAGANQTAYRVHMVTLNGSASDPDNDIISYLWRQAGGPAVTLSNNTASNPAFTAPDVVGAVVFELIVSDGHDTATDAVAITVVNRPPVSNAGMGQTARFGDAVTLDGSASYDPDNDAISYIWNQTSGTAVTLSDNTASNPTFTAPGTAGTLIFEIAVSDGYDTGADTVTVTVIGAPTANAGMDQTVHRLQTVSLDGSASYDPDNDALSYLWKQTAGPTVTLSNGTAPSPTLTSPNSAAAITFELTVSDGEYSDVDEVAINVVNRPPVANAGPDRTAQSGESMILSGAASADADGDILSYSWSVVTGPRISLTNPDSAQVSFVAPTGPTLLGILLTVHDGWHSSQDLVVIDVLRPPNRPPVSDAGPDPTAGYGKTIQLDGSASDPDGDAISYVWNQTAGIAVPLSDHTIPKPAFTTPTTTTSITFELTVSDGHLAHTDAVTVTVANRPPAADAGADQTAGFGHTVTLDGSASDPDGDAISYMWNQTSGPSVILSDNAALSPSFAAPASMATMTFEITASDGWLSHTDAVAITVVNYPPVASAGADQTVQLGDTVTLDGSASRDPDNDIISYTWKQTTGPAVVLSDDAASSPTFTAPSSAGMLTFELTVSDGYDTDTDTVTITVVNRPPVASAGADQTVRFGDTVTLDGSASTDPDGDAISYVWKEMSGTGTKLSDTTVQSPTFTAPGSAATITFELTVSDGEFTSTDTVTITVKHPNRAPTANAGVDQTAGVGDTITLSGAASTDPDNDTLTYSWSVIIGPRDILSGASGSSVTVTVPGGVGLLGILLTVSDGEFTSEDLVVITVG